MRHLKKAAVIPAMAAMLAAVPAAAQSEMNFGTKEDEQNIIAGICGTQIPLDAAGCACFAEHAMTGLTDPQRAYLILTVVQPPAADRLDVAHSPDDLRMIFQFIEATQKTCTTAAVAPEAGETAPADGAASPQQ